MITAPFAKLYKRTSTGAVQQWQIEVDHNEGAYRTISGQVGGKLVTSEWTVCEGKNIGRSNETTPAEQARKEATAKFNKKCENHYNYKLEDADKTSFTKPMLAQPFDKFDGDFSDLYSQPKLDGMRCFTNHAGMKSRGGKPIISAPHIHAALKDFLSEYPEVTLDGELYTDALKDDFNKIISLAKQSKPTAAKLAESAKHLQYWVYDMIYPGDPDFLSRIRSLHGAFVNIPGIVVVDTHRVPTKETMDQLYSEYLAAGMEGQMLRHGSSIYEGKRSKHLLKRKEFVDEEFTVIALNEGKGNYAGMVKSVSLMNDKGQQFDAGIKGNQAYLKSLMNFSLQSDSEATVRYQNLTPDGIPRFGIVYKIWDGKRDV